MARRQVRATHRGHSSVRLEVTAYVAKGRKSPDRQVDTRTTRGYCRWLGLGNRFPKLMAYLRRIEPGVGTPRSRHSPPRLEWPVVADSGRSERVNGSSGLECPEATRFSRWTPRGECLLCQQMRSFSSSHLTGTIGQERPNTPRRESSLECQNELMKIVVIRGPAFVQLVFATPDPFVFCETRLMSIERTCHHSGHVKSYRFPSSLEVLYFSSRIWKEIRGCLPRTSDSERL